MKNVTTPRQLSEGYLKGIGFVPEDKPSPVLFVLGLVVGICLGAMI